MTDEASVHPTSQEGESTQQDVTTLDQSTSTGEEVELTPEQQAEKDEAAKAKDPNAWAVKRIGDLTRQRHEAERKAEQKDQEIARYKALFDQKQKDEGVDTITPNASPEAIDALVEQRAQEKARAQASQERGQSVAKQGAETYTDFTHAVQTLDALGITNDQVASLLGMDDAHSVIYHLGKNPEEAVRILSLPPLQQGRELERLSAKASKAPAPPAVSKAPNPITPVDSNATASKDQAKMTTAEWMAWRNKTAKTRV